MEYRRVVAHNLVLLISASTDAPPPSSSTFSSAFAASQSDGSRAAVAEAGPAGHPYATAPPAAATASCDVQRAFVRAALERILMLAATPGQPTQSQSQTQSQSESQSQNTSQAAGFGGKSCSESGLSSSSRHPVPHESDADHHNNHEHDRSHFGSLPDRASVDPGKRSNGANGRPRRGDLSRRKLSMLSKEDDHHHHDAADGSDQASAGTADETVNARQDIETKSDDASVWERNQLHLSAVAKLVASREISRVAIVTTTERAEQVTLYSQSSEGSEIGWMDFSDLSNVRSALQKMDQVAATPSEQPNGTSNSHTPVACAALLHQLLDQHSNRAFRSSPCLVRPGERQAAATAAGAASPRKPTPLSPGGMPLFDSPQKNSSKLQQQPVRPPLPATTPEEDLLHVVWITATPLETAVDSTAALGLLGGMRRASTWHDSFVSLLCCEHQCKTGERSSSQHKRIRLVDATSDASSSADSTQAMVEDFIPGVTVESFRFSHPSSVHEPESPRGPAHTPSSSTRHKRSYAAVDNETSGHGWSSFELISQFAPFSPSPLSASPSCHSVYSAGFDKTPSVPLNGSIAALAFQRMLARTCITAGQSVVCACVNLSALLPTGALSDELVQSMTPAQHRLAHKLARAAQGTMMPQNIATSSLQLLSIVKCESMPLELLGSRECDMQLDIACLDGTYSPQTAPCLLRAWLARERDFLASTATTPLTARRMPGNCALLLRLSSSATPRAGFVAQNAGKPRTTLNWLRSASVLPTATKWRSMVWSTPPASDEPMTKSIDTSTFATLGTLVGYVAADGRILVTPLLSSNRLPSDVRGPHPQMEETLTVEREYLDALAQPTQLSAFIKKTLQPASEHEPAISVHPFIARVLESKGLRNVQNHVACTSTSVSATTNGATSHSQPMASSSKMPSARLLQSASGLGASPSDLLHSGPARGGSSTAPPARLEMDPVAMQCRLLDLRADDQASVSLADVMETGWIADKKRAAAVARLLQDVRGKVERDYDADIAVGTPEHWKARIQALGEIRSFAPLSAHGIDYNSEQVCDMVDTHMMVSHLPLLAATADLRRPDREGRASTVASHRRDAAEMSANQADKKARGGAGPSRVPAFSAAQPSKNVRASNGAALLQEKQDRRSRDGTAQPAGHVSRPSAAPDRSIEEANRREVKRLSSEAIGASIPKTDKQHGHLVTILYRMVIVLLEARSGGLNSALIPTADIQSKVNGLVNQVVPISAESRPRT
ncbi:hypothetical protein CAOG_05745 [Capsaspora owczarzaki ATCC 30864]|uniref:Uncharacterized protein n=1 Tax=Capsaspora owczarzaki (strain ATCC 30864) TaxID=595528 RepID=A0A0D2WU10_CAPO3|nr:hypothetical protein CAOG_05745 [Capsaspora owczarzaki ATCC 30864]KJE95273.1 hypothetical protein CAOG_005745 [Capsaspora owczarzaki ATCC 30864]|eukprot:XP_004346418.1 hypothetical protein CAOG_05745 [Capsaspora owczarzaki ATCC 30864]